MSLNRLTDHDRKQSIEALLFVSGDALSLKELSLGLGEPADRVKSMLEELMNEYLDRGGRFFLLKKEGIIISLKRTLQLFRRYSVI